MLGLQSTTNCQISSLRNFGNYLMAPQICGSFKEQDVSAQMMKSFAYRKPIWFGLIQDDPKGKRQALVFLGNVVCRVRGNCWTIALEGCESFVVGCGCDKCKKANPYLCCYSLNPDETYEDWRSIAVSSKIIPPNFRRHAKAIDFWIYENSGCFCRHR